METWKNKNTEHDKSKMRTWNMKIKNENMEHETRKMEKHNLKIWRTKTRIMQN
mgnify:CR=1 FL=1